MKKKRRTETKRALEDASDTEREKEERKEEKEIERQYKRVIFSAAVNARVGTRRTFFASVFVSLFCLSPRGEREYSAHGGGNNNSRVFSDCIPLAEVSRSRGD